MSPRVWSVFISAQILFLVAAGFVAARVSASNASGSASSEAQDLIAVAEALTSAREACYAAPDCPNLDALMALFATEPRRTEITRANDLLLLEGAEALRADHLRVAERFTGRRVETVWAQAHGRNAILLQLNWDPGASEPNPFVSVFRVEDGKAAHWVLIAP